MNSVILEPIFLYISMWYLPDNYLLLVIPIAHHSPLHNSGAPLSLTPKMRASTFLLTLLSVPLAHTAPTFIAIPEGGLNIRQSSDTRNELTDGSACKSVTVIFARGTTESGNVGTLVGPPFFSALVTSIGAENLAVQGVNYPADIAGFLAGGDAAGSKKMAELVGQAITQCPDTKVVMSGYS